MRLLTISHSCAVDANQQQYVALQKLDNVDLELIAPARWTSEYRRGSPLKPTLLPSVRFHVHFLPVAFAGHVSLHFYTRLPIAKLRKFAPDMILSTQEPWSFSGFQAVCLSRFLRAPLVFQTNQNILKRYPPPFSWIERASYRTAVAALAYSEEARQVMIQKGLRSPSAVVPYGTDVSLFKPGTSPHLRATLGLGDRIVLGYMGRLVPEKGIDDLFRAAALLRNLSRDTAFAVILVGSGPEETRLQELSKQLNLESYVRFVGGVSHLQAADYMNCFDVLVLPSRTTPSWKEQFGRVIVEAMASGLPVVGSSSGQIPNLIRETGGGLVFEEGNINDLANTLLRLLQNVELRKGLGQAGACAVQTRFTCEAVADQLYQILSQFAK